MTDREADQNQSNSGVKTFPVPFAPGELKESISITTNSPAAKPSKEEIIEKAFQLHLNGNVIEAAKYYQYFINRGFNDHRVFCNYAAIFQSNRKAKEAESLLRKAIQLKPDYANAYLILASALEDLDKYKEAELSLRKAVKIKPDFAEAHYSLGNTLKDLGKLTEAELSLRKAIKLKPELINAYTSLGNVLKVLEES